MAKGKKKRAESPQRLVDQQTLKAFWDFMSQHFPGLRIDLSLFDYKAGEFNKPKVSKEDYAREPNVPVEKVYDTVIKLLPEYHQGKDILWKPSDYYKEHREELVSLIWLDDFKLDNPFGYTPLVYLWTSEGKYQAFFKLAEPVPVDDADLIQKTMVKALGLGDKGATSFFQHRRMPGLANGKYDPEPLVIFTIPENPTLITVKEIKTIEGRREGGVAENNNGQVAERQTEGQELPKRTGGYYIRPVVPINYKPVLIRPRSDFIKRRPDGTIDESATDMAWATHIVRFTYEAGWDEGSIAFSVYEELLCNSPEVERRKKTPRHLRDYLYRTVWKAIKRVKETPSELKPKEPSDI